MGPSGGSEDSSEARFSLGVEFDVSLSFGVAEVFSAGEEIVGRFFLTTIPLRTGFEGFEGFLEGAVPDFSTFLLADFGLF